MSPDGSVLLAGCGEEGKPGEVYILRAPGHGAGVR
jgi:hypothetical protein